MDFKGYSLPRTLPGGLRLVALPLNHPALASDGGLRDYLRANGHGEPSQESGGAYHEAIDFIRQHAEAAGVGFELVDASEAHVTLTIPLGGAHQRKLVVVRGKP